MPRGRPGRGRCAGRSGRFRTAPEAAGEFTFAFSADLEAGHQPFTLLDHDRPPPAELLRLPGRHRYADVPRTSFEPTLAYYRAKHRENRDDRASRAAAGRLRHVYAMWDDHEVQNDFNGTNPYIPQGRQAFGEYWPVGGVTPTLLYRRFAWGPARTSSRSTAASTAAPSATSRRPGRRCSARARRRG